MGLWDLKAEWYDGWRRNWIVGWILEKEKRNLRLLVDSMPDRPQTVVDLGTGAGSTLDVFPGSARVIGMDRSFSMIRLAGKKRRMTGIAGDIRRPPFRERSIRFLSVIGVLEYIPDFQAFLREAESLLTETGYLLVTISPFGPLNSLRRFLGHPLYPVKPDVWKKAVESFPFVCLQSRKSLLQRQFLYRRETV